MKHSLSALLTAGAMAFTLCACETETTRSTTTTTEEQQAVVPAATTTTTEQTTVEHPVVAPQ